MSAGAYSRAFHGLGPRMWPNGAAYAADRRAGTRVSLLAHGRVVYLAYNTTTVDTSPVAARLLRLASKPRVRRVVVDLRNNRGGDNQTYPPLIQALKRLGHKHKTIVVLAGRATFSAAANFMGDLERATRYLLVGEDSGGAPNLYGDVEPLDLPTDRAARRGSDDLVGEEQARRERPARHLPSGRRRAADREVLVRPPRPGARGGAEGAVLEGPHDPLRLVETLARLEFHGVLR